ncbi:NADPH-dependent FMN reductase [Nonomuraea sp. NPDC050663]|uniref:NADPH-dependent FMN reductase n=1 Tax=Nonomuraea sp. NPDC050663 TaxID=3364370 RepID=UPI0037AC5D1F
MRELRIAVIIASTRQGRFGPTVAGWFAEQARKHFQVDLIDLAQAGLPAVLQDDEPAEVAALGSRLAAADGFVIVTPEYNHSFPAPLKTALDWYFEEWHAKPVSFVAYGRESGGLMAVAQLRQICIELRAVPIREIVALPNYWELFTAEGAWPRPYAVCDEAVKTMLDRLGWWAQILRNGRTVS